MKYLLSLLVLSLTLFGEEFSGPTHLTLKIFDTLTIQGPAQLKMVKAKSLAVTGLLEFNHLNISGDATLTGAVKGSKGKFNTLTVTGSLDVDHVICKELIVTGNVKATFLDVAKQSTVNGDLEVKESKLGALSVAGDKILLDGVLLDSLTVRKGISDQQTVTLQGATIVNGDILFESGKGILNVQGSEVKINGTTKGNL